MPIPLRFDMRLSVDHETPSPAPPTVLLYAPGASTAWSVAQGAVSTSGMGTWSVAPDPADQPAGAPFVLLYATAQGADPTATFYYLGDPAQVASWPYQAGSVPAVPFFFWLGSAASSNYLPATGLAPAPSLAINGTAAAAGAGAVAELGNGFYTYMPTAGEMGSAAFAGASYADVVLTATATGAVPAWVDFQVVVPPGVATSGALATDSGYRLLLESGGALLQESVATWYISYWQAAEVSSVTTADAYSLPNAAEVPS